MAKKHDARRIGTTNDRPRVKKVDELERALSDVRDGLAPRLAVSDRYGTIEVEDPYETSPDGSKVKRTKVTSLRDDPISRMYVQGQLKHEKDRDNLDAKVRFLAARRWQDIYEASEIGGANAIDFTREVVDGGLMAQPDTDKRIGAQAQLNRLWPMLGKEGSNLVRRVLGEKRDLTEIVTMSGVKLHPDRRRAREQREYPRLRLLEALDTLADAFALRAIRGAPGPRRQRDGWDELAPYAENARLVEAIRRARRDRA